MKALLLILLACLALPAVARAEEGLPSEPDVYITVQDIKWRVQAAFLNGRLEVDFGWASNKPRLVSALMEEATSFIVWSPLWNLKTDDPILIREKRFLQRSYNISMLGLRGDHPRLFSDLATDQSVRAVEVTRSLWRFPPP